MRLIKRPSFGAAFLFFGRIMRHFGIDEPGMHGRINEAAHAYRNAPRKKANPRYANGNARRKIRARWKAIGAPCALCGKPIDYSLGMVVDAATGRKRPHPMSFVVDEILPVSQGGSPTDFANTQPAHWLCNARKGDGTRAKSPTARPLPQPFDEF